MGLSQNLLFLVVLLLVVGAAAYVWLGPRGKKSGAGSQDPAKKPEKPTPSKSSSAPDAGSASKASTPKPSAAKPAPKPAPKAAPKPAPKPEPEPLYDNNDEDITMVGSLSAVDDEPTGEFQLVLVTAVGQTDVGRRRKHNEDSYAILDDQHLFVVADGMGGHAAGDVASKLAVESLAKAFKTRDFVGKAHPRLPPRGDELVRAIKMANTAVYTAAQEDRALNGMGTTLVAARFSPGKQRVYVAHVGDSRCYRLREEEFVQLTRDHTYEQLGLKGPMGAQLSRAVGTDEVVEVDLYIDDTQINDVYVLCSDGLSKMVSDGDVQAVLTEHKDDLSKGCQRLIETANERGGRDNVTVILVNVRRP